mgnify:CR=1 FL=1
MDHYGNVADLPRTGNFSDLYGLALENLHEISQV